jgi:hypothetical protein
MKTNTEKFKVVKFVGGYYVYNTTVPEKSIHQKYYGDTSNKNKPFKKKESAQRLCDSMNEE